VLGASSDHNAVVAQLNAEGLRVAPTPPVDRSGESDRPLSASSNGTTLTVTRSNLLRSSID
jgi:hypothetical protein